MGHHYIPQFIIRNFVSDDNQVFYYNKHSVKQEICRRTPKRIFHEYNLNSFLDESQNINSSFEAVYNTRENYWSSHLRGILERVRRGEGHAFDVSEREVLADFYYCQIQRHPVFLAGSKEGIDTGRRIYQDSFPAAPVDIIRHDMEEARRWALLGKDSNMLQILKINGFKIFHLFDGSQFALSDCFPYSAAARSIMVIAPDLAIAPNFHREDIFHFYGASFSGPFNRALLSGGNLFASKSEDVLDDLRSRRAARLTPATTAP